METAVDFLMNEVMNGTMTLREAYNQAKEMEKQQIMDAYEDGTYHNTFGNENYESSEKYYHNRFNK
jgi:hypothetical protein